MTGRTFLFYALFSLTSLPIYGQLAPVSRQKDRCGDFCTFYFCKPDADRTVFDVVGPRLIVRDANVASFPFVCRKIVPSGRDFFNQTVRVGKTAEALVHPADDRNESPRPFVPISKFRPDGLSPPYPKTYFSLRDIDRFPPLPGEKGISRSANKGNQEEFIDDLCVYIPIRSYDLLNEDLSLDRRVRRTKELEDCVSFRTTAPRILVELTWDSPDDLDLRVEEPNGNVVSFRKPKTATGGRLIMDNNISNCGIDPVGREQVRWGRPGSPLEGRYIVTVQHFNNCGTGPTNWALAVTIEGENVLFEKGTSDNDKDTRILKAKFNYEGPSF